jgi:hypothetical protein
MIGRKGEYNIMDNLLNLVENIKNRDDFVTFVKALYKNLEENPDDWENDKLWNYLEALAASANDLDGAYLNKNENIPKDIDWKILGKLLIMAKYYE